MVNITRYQRRNTTPVIAPLKRVAMGQELEDLQARLARLRRQTEVYPKIQQPVATSGKQRPA
jgi:hypothetical protein